MARKADAADGGSQSAALERESEQHGEASREQEAEESAREADSDSQPWRTASLTPTSVLPHAGSAHRACGALASCAGQFHAPGGNR